MGKKVDKPKDPETCDKCGGVGAVLDADKQVIVCPKCNGDGVLR